MNAEFVPVKSTGFPSTSFPKDEVTFNVLLVKLDKLEALLNDANTLMKRKSGLRGLRDPYPFCKL